MSFSKGKTQGTDAEIAIKRSAQSAYAKYPKHFISPDTSVLPPVNPSFAFPSGATIFTIGSCFARHIEVRLQEHGFDIPTLDFKSIAPRQSGRGVSVLNKNTPMSILEEVRWAHQQYNDPNTVVAEQADFFYVLPNKQVVDMHLDNRPVDLDEALKQRQQLFAIYQHLFTTPYIIITFGLIEAWRDNKVQRYIRRMPNRAMRRDKNRFSFHQLTVSEVKAAMQEIIQLIRSINPQAKFIFTISPIPMRRTFTEQDVITANMQSKSVLRAACGEVVQQHDGVDYFPSYEIVMLTGRSAFLDDGRHIKYRLIKQIVNRAINSYIGNQPIQATTSASVSLP